MKKAALIKKLDVVIMMKSIIPLILMEKQKIISMTISTKRNTNMIIIMITSMTISMIISMNMSTSMNINMSKN